MAKFGCPPRFIAIANMRQFHDGMQARVQNDGVLRTFWGNEWGHTGVCYGTNSVQHDVFCYAHGCFSRTATLIFQSGTVLMAIY